MKSAYEIAMARLEKESGPTRKLTDAQKARIAEIEKKYEAKIAEHRLHADQRLASAQTMQEREQMRGELSGDLRNLEEKRDREKEAVWNNE